MNRLIARQKRAALITVVVTLLWCSSSPDAFASPQSRHRPAVEEFSFLLKDFKMDHQGEVNNVNISVRLRYKPNVSDSEYPDFRAVAKDIETLLSNYPNKTDYWEIVNKKITSLVLTKYAVVTKIASEIQVSPSAGVPYQRSSTVTRERT